MKHLVVFVVIGIVLGAVAAFTAEPKPRSPILPLIGGLVGGLVGGEALERTTHGAVAKYVSLVTAVVLGAVLAWLGRLLAPKPS